LTATAATASMSFERLVEALGRLMSGECAMTEEE
jgi:hypothetical protein